MFVTKEVYIHKSIYYYFNFASEGKNSCIIDKFKNISGGDTIETINVRIHIGMNNHVNKSLQLMNELDLTCAWKGGPTNTSISELIGEIYGLTSLNVYINILNSKNDNENYMVFRFLDNLSIRTKNGLQTKNGGLNVRISNYSGTSLCIPPTSHDMSSLTLKNCSSLKHVFNRKIECIWSIKFDNCLKMIYLPDGMNTNHLDFKPSYMKDKLKRFDYFGWNLSGYDSAYSYNRYNRYNIICLMLVKNHIPRLRKKKQVRLPDELIMLLAKKLRLSVCASSTVSKKGYDLTIHDNMLKISYQILDYK
jgi:hypothetical protein